MFSYFIFLVASSVTFLCTHQVSSQESNCTENPVFTPSALVVMYGDPANAACEVCQKDCGGDVFGLEKPVGEVTENGTTMLWTVDRLTEWDISVMCYYTNDAGDQCTSTLDLSVYQPPESVSISFVNHTGPMTEKDQYTLQCSVQNVAPVQSLTVTFYRGNTTLDHLKSNSEQKKPVNETFTLNITPSREDDGAQYWCEAKLELGPDGPQSPPVVTSEILNATFYFEIITTKKPDPTTIKSTRTSTTRPTRPQTTQSITTTTKSTTSSATTATTTAATTTTATTTAATTTAATTTAATTTTATTTAATTTAATTTAAIAQRSTAPNSSSDRILTHSFMCLMLLFSALI